MAHMNLKEFEKLLLEKKAMVEGNLEKLRNEMNLLSTEDELDDMADVASVTHDASDHKAQIDRMAKELAEINAALGRITSGLYGVCEKSGQPIPLERLRAEPTARTVVR